MKVYVLFYRNEWVIGALGVFSSMENAKEAIGTAINRGGFDPDHTPKITSTTTGCSDGGHNYNCYNEHYSDGSVFTVEECGFDVLPDILRLMGPPNV